MARASRIEVVFREVGVNRVRNRQGQFIKRDVEANKAFFAEQAQKAQAQVVQRISDRIIRQSVSTGRLERVSASAKNRVADEYGFGVGVIRYLDKSEAKYWRTIEEGSKVVWADTPGGRSSMVGMQLRGKFGGSIIGWAPVGRWGNQPKAGPRWGAPGGKLRWYWSMPANPNFTVKEDIRPMHAYRDVYEGSNIFKRETPAFIASFLRKVARRAILGR